MTQGYAHLRSGTDIRGRAVESNGQAPVLTEDVGLAVGAAFSRWLGRTMGKRADQLTVAVGHDSRVTAEALSAAIIGGLQSIGAQVLDCGLCTTPAMFMTTVLAGCHGAVMVTASHLPWEQNGYKFFSRAGGLSGGDVAGILEDAFEHPVEPVKSVTTKTDFLDIYQDFLMKKVTAWLGQEKPLTGLHVIVDAGNGAGGFYAGLLSRLGACTKGSQFLTPDGHFPNHMPNPELPEAMAALSEAVLREKADLGVIFDADCDRAALVDEQGRSINRNRLIALTTAMLLEEVRGITVVTDSVTSAGLEDFITEKGGKMHRFKRGYRNVIEEAERLCAKGVDCQLAIETSGHAALRENFFLDDGMYLATRLIVVAKRLQVAGQRIGDLIATLQEPEESVELRLNILAVDFRSAGETVLQSIRNAAQRRPGWMIDSGNREGERVLCGSKENWFLMRMSLHDPLLVLNVESMVRGGVGKIIQSVRKIIAAHPEVDCTALDAWLLNE